MNVKFWIDKAKNQWLRVDAEVKQAVSIYGPLAKLEPGTMFTLEHAAVSATLWLPKRFTMHATTGPQGPPSMR